MVIQAEQLPFDELLQRIPDTVDFDVVAPEPAEGEPGLVRWLTAALTAELGLASAEPDEDGDIPVPLGRTIVYVRPGDADAPFLTVIALLLEEFEPTLAVFEAVNAINVQTPMAKTTVDVDTQQIVTTVELPVVDGLSVEDLLLAIEIVGEAADYFDELLQGRFGGVTSRGA